LAFKAAFSAYGARMGSILWWLALLLGLGSLWTKKGWIYGLTNRIRTPLVKGWLQGKGFLY